MNDTRIVITGVGPVTAIGVGREAFAAALADGVSAVDTIDLFDPAPYGAALAAELHDFEVDGYLPSQKTYLDRSCEFAMAAMSLAIADAGLDLEALDRNRVGLILGSAAAGLDTMALFFADYLKKGPRFVKPFLFPHTYSNTAISMLAIEYGLTGYHMNYAAGAIAGALAIVDACMQLRAGKADVVFCGGFEAFSEPLFAGHAGMDRLSTVMEPEDVGAPFAEARKGYVLGEGAAILVLESLEHARRRGATILAEVLAAVPSSDDEAGGEGAGWAGIARAMRRALADAALPPAAIDGVSAAANGSLHMDANEARAIADVFGGEADGGAPVTTAVKSMVGETLGAGGPMQVAAAVAALRAGVIHGIAGLQALPAEFCLSVAEHSRPCALKVMLVNAIDAGGGIVSLILRAAGVEGMNECA